jgi:hypothetical protein
MVEGGCFEVIAAEYQGYFEVIEAEIGHFASLVSMARVGLPFAQRMG